MSVLTLLNNKVKNWNQQVQENLSVSDITTAYAEADKIEGTDDVRFQHVCINSFANVSKLS